ncbi:hypothetical protein ABW19_dt0207011 [Dactylella cylindrospora]|nr:hypothetical protein ABW19_dt0207011 [Dactylella cylindrospora]
MSDPSSTSSSATPPPKPPVSYDRPRNIQYWLRCLRTILPTEYTSNDLNRTSLAFFCVNGLNILGELGNLTKPAERDNWIEWIYNLQHPDGGFRSSPGTLFGDRRNESNAIWDPATLPGTFFSLVILAALGDDLSRVRREETLEWVASLQRPDGSFADMYTENETDSVAVKDVRFVYLASATRWILKGEEGSLEREIKDINVDQAVRYLQSTECYDGGFGGRPGMESHAGHTYCVLAGLHFLDRLQTPKTPVPYPCGLPNPERTIHWLVSRQQALSPTADTLDYVPNPAVSPPPATFPAPDDHNGFNGRANKKTDTCYSFWVCGCLEMLKKSHLVDPESNRQFLLEHTAHRIGGFGKWANTPPDVMHSYLGAVALAMYREPGFNRIDSGLCTALQTRERIEGFEWRKKKEAKS